MNKSFTDLELEQAVKQSINLSQICDLLGLYKCGSSYNILNNHIVKLNLNTSHWENKKRISKKYSIKEICVKQSPYLGGTSNLKTKLLKNNLLKYECYICKLSKWLDKEISLQLDHTNGDRYDNRLENLRLLCPNCHSQTETYAGKNFDREKKKYYCKNCNCLTSYNATLCRKCCDLSKINKNTRIEWPDLKVLKKMLYQSNYVQVGKQLGVSDNAIKKHIRNLEKMNNKKNKESGECFN